MIDEHGIDRKYTHSMSFPPETWERIFGKTDTESVEEESLILNTTFHGKHFLTQEMIDDINAGLPDADKI